MHRCSIFCILPPHVLQHVAQAGDDGQRRAALATLSGDHTVRSARIANAAATVTPVATQYVDVLGQAGSGQKRRTVADCHHDQEIRGATVMRSEGQDPTGDPAVDEAYDGLGATYDLYHEAYERDSIDNQGMSLDGFVHFGQDYDNAFWDGTQMVFGDGDGTLFQRFTIAVDVIGHELTHGVTQHEANLQYFGQSGALNESISDVFGSLVKQWAAQQTADQADWLIGAGLLAPGVQGRALRDMREPGTAYDDPVLGKDPQPAHMRDFVKTFEDNGGVHINSGIPNRAFALAATTLGGSAWERAGTVWYAALRDPRLRPTATFRSFARATVRNATRLFGDDVATAVHDAWGDVGVRVQR